MVTAAELMRVVESAATAGHVTSMQNDFKASSRKNSALSIKYGRLLKGNKNLRPNR